MYIRLIVLQNPFFKVKCGFAPSNLSVECLWRSLPSPAGVSRSLVVLLCICESHLVVRVMWHWAKVKTKTFVVNYWLRDGMLQNWLMRSRKIKVRTKTEVLKGVSVVAMGSRRAPHFASCGITYQRFSRFTRVVWLFVVMSYIVMVACSCSTMIDRLTN